MIVLWWVACAATGVVEQGRAIAFDAEAKSVTVVLDRSETAGRADYSGAVTTFVLPDDPHERGPDPVVGGVVAVDPAGEAVTVVVDGALRRVGLEGATAEQVDPKDARVWDAEAKKARSFPRYDAASGALSLWFPKESRLVVGRVPEADRALPESTWKLGDEVRLYVKEPPVAARFMNVTRTDIYKK